MSDGFLGWKMAGVAYPMKCELNQDREKFCLLSPDDLNDTVTAECAQHFLCCRVRAPDIVSLSVVHGGKLEARQANGCRRTGTTTQIWPSHQKSQVGCAKNLGRMGLARC